MVVDTTAEQTTSTGRNLFEGPFPAKILATPESDSGSLLARVGKAQENIKALHIAYYGADDDFGDPLIQLRKSTSPNVYTDPSNV